MFIMDYKILNIHTVTVTIDDDLDPYDVTTIEVGYAWDGNQSFSRIDIKGRPSDDEILAAISKKGSELRVQGQAPPGSSLPREGKLLI